MPICHRYKSLVCAHVDEIEWFFGHNLTLMQTPICLCTWISCSKTYSNPFAMIKHVFIFKSILWRRNDQSRWQIESACPFVDFIKNTHTLNSYTHTKNTHLMKPDFLLRTNNTSILSFLSECFTKNKNKNTQKQQHPFSLLINDFNRSCHSQYSHSRSLPKLSSQDEEGGAGLGFPSGGPAHFEPIPHDHDFW